MRARADAKKCPAIQQLKLLIVSYKYTMLSCRGVKELIYWILRIVKPTR